MAERRPVYAAAVNKFSFERSFESGWVSHQWPPSLTPANPALDGHLMRHKTCFCQGYESSLYDFVSGILIGNVLLINKKSYVHDIILLLGVEAL